MPQRLTLAVPKGRILLEIVPLLDQMGITTTPSLLDESRRDLHFTTNHPALDIIRVRAFDVATFVAFGAAQIGVVGHDVLIEFDYPELYAPIDCRIGKCRLVLAGLPNHPDLRAVSHTRVATKYPRLTKHYFQERNIQAECIKLHGAIELAPTMELSPFIVDLVSSGKTLQTHHLIEIDTITKVSSKVIVNRTAYKTSHRAIQPWLDLFTTTLKTQL